MSPKLTIIEVRNSVVKIGEENTEVKNHKKVLGKNPKPQTKKLQITQKNTISLW